MELKDAVVDLHSEVHLHVQTSRTARGRIRYTATLRGVDFLDGDWSTEHTGTARTVNDALKKAVSHFTR